MAKTTKQVAERNGIYKVTAQANALINPHDDFKGRLHQSDWVIFLGQREYMVLAVNGSRVRGLEAYRFRGDPMGTPIWWKPTNQEVGLLIAGQTITAPMDLASQLPPESPTVMLRQGMGGVQGD